MHFTATLALIAASSALALALPQPQQQGGLESRQGGCNIGECIAHLSPVTLFNCYAAEFSAGTLTPADIACVGAVVTSLVNPPSECAGCEIPPPPIDKPF